MKMVMMQPTHFSGKRLFIRMAGAACLVLVLMISPMRVFAQCEDPNGTYSATRAEAVVITDQTAGILNMQNNIILGWSTDLDTLRGDLGLMNRDIIMQKLNEFWTRWGGAWRGMATQLSSGISDQSRQLGSFNDTSNALTAALDEQKQRVKSTLLYQPTDQACRFDTTATYMTPTRATSEALENGYEWDFVRAGNNEKGSLAETGPQNLQDQLWQRYTSEFCDPLAENANAGCTLPPGYWYSNMDALPGKMFFSQDTIDMAAQAQLDAVNSIIFNVTGYIVPTPILPGALGSPAGMTQVLNRRQYITQMGTVGALLYSVIAERAPGPAKIPPGPPTKWCEFGHCEMMPGSPAVPYKQGQDIQDLRTSMGVVPYIEALSNWMPPLSMGEATNMPSQREVRQSIIEQLWDPNYYKQLYDNPSTMAQKEVYLKAYSLVLLYDMIEKQEKISDVYAVQTANVLNQLSGSLAPLSSTQPLK